MKKISIFILIFLITANCVFCAENDAKAQAYKDIKNKDYKILVYGEPLAGKIDHITYKDKSIKLERVAGCTAEEEQVQYWNTYNSIVQKELLDGNEIWKLVDEEIEKSKNRNNL